MKGRTTSCEQLENYQEKSVNNPLKIQHLPSGDIIDFFLPFEIEDSEDFIDFLRAVREAKSTDLIRIHIDCCGGDVGTAFIIYDTLRMTQATVEISVEGICASAASLIMLAGDQWEILEHAHVMIHAWSGMIYGKWHEQKAKFHFDEKSTEEDWRKAYKGFLTDQEIEEVLDGKDIWLTASETLDRLGKFKEKDIRRQQIIDQIAREQQAEINKKLEVALSAFDKEEKAKEKEYEKAKAKKASSSTSRSKKTK